MLNRLQSLPLRLGCPREIYWWREFSPVIAAWPPALVSILVLPGAQSNPSGRGSGQFELHSTIGFHNPIIQAPA